MQCSSEGFHLTLGFAAAALRAGFGGGWAETAVDWSRSRLGDHGLSAYAVNYALRFLSADRGHDASGPADTDAHIEAWRGRLSPDGVLPMDGGAEGERLPPWNLTADPWTAQDTRGQDHAPACRLFTGDQLRADLDRVARGQQEDGGWHVDWAAWYPGQDLDWRGIRTVEVLQLLGDAHRAV